jgi:glutathione peroxidase-family protein
MNVRDFDATTADGGSKPLSDYAACTLLIVNVASKCGLMPRYVGLATPGPLAYAQPSGSRIVPGR